jgi:F-type H+-transporting ATPase subunit epsilon
VAKLFFLEIVTTTSTAYKGEIIHVRAPGVDGDFGVLADHAPMMAGLRPGRVRLDESDESFDYVITGGFFEVHNNRAVILAEECWKREDIDLERALQARERALQMLADAQTTEAQEEARIALTKAVAIIQFAEKE